VKKNAGFTLIEVIAVLVLVGIISAVAGMGIVRGVEGYLFAQSNTETTQKAQLALARMTRELMELSTIDATSSGTAIIFSTPSGDKTIALAGSTITLDGDVLTDSVKSADGFTVSYCESGSVLSCTVPPDPPSAAVIADPKLLARIDIILRLIRPDVAIGYLEFTTSVVPRQTRVQNAPKG
jgi:prepilin-type N-terminal cleavage/methylation domain-containing protein